MNAGATTGSAGDRSGQVALLLPGMTLNSTIFPDLGMPVVAPDFSDLQLGSDGSCAELVEGGMSYYARLLDGTLASSEVWHGRRRVVVAHSFGGMLALRWLIDHGCSGLADIESLVLIATTAGPMYDRVGVRLLRVQDFELRLGIRFLIDWWNRPAVTRQVKRMISGGTTNASPVDFQKTRIESDFDLDMAGWRNTSWQAMRSYRIALDRFDVRERLQEIKVPTVVLHGTHDSLFEIDVAHDLSHRLPRAELRIVEGAGHALPLTHGPVVAQAVTELMET
ncbi:MAG: alpha/beta hydrolase [Gemmatimonadota bacterium]|nr:MAG: alpha/beta hydrolase [Gemmatimonadota bacterium]